MRWIAHLHRKTIVDLRHSDYVITVVALDTGLQTQNWTTGVQSQLR